MNKVLAITYDLKSRSKNYAPLYDAIKQSSKWWHYLPSTWLVYTADTPDMVWNRLSSLIDKNDRLLIVEVTGNYQGWLPPDAWKWINERFPVRSNN